MTDSPRSPGLIERYQEELQVRHYARRTVSASTQNQALAAVLFLYRELLGQPLVLDSVVRARTRHRLPVLLSHQPWW